MSSRRLPPALVIAAALLTALGTLLAVTVTGHSTRATPDQRAHDIAATLHCPVCADLSAADSPSPLARQMRQRIRTELAAGASTEEIQQRFVASYGPSVLMSPPNQGWGRAAHFTPVLLLTVSLLLGGAVLTKGLRKERTLGAPRELQEDTP